MKFSCIMGTYNPNPEWLKRALKSTWGLFDELIVVDDGSKDGISITSEDYPYKNLKLKRHEPNQGFYAAKNTAIALSTGDIIATLDDDDYFSVDGVIKLRQFIESNPDGDVWRFKLQEFGLSNGIYDGGGDLKELTWRNSIPGISWYKRSMWEELGGFKKVRAEDWNFWLRAHRAGKKFTFVPEIVYNVNVRADSVSRSWGYFEGIKQEVLDNL